MVKKDPCVKFQITPTKPGGNDDYNGDNGDHPFDCLIISFDIENEDSLSDIVAC